MGVYVKDLEMPKDCGTCDFRVNNFTCLASSGAVLKVLYKRPDWCPLVEVKFPHGDLIDRDELQPDIFRDWEDCGYNADDAYSERCIANAPAVIEREGVEP